MLSGIPIYKINKDFIMGKDWIPVYDTNGRLIFISVSNVEKLRQDIDSYNEKGS